MTTPDLLAASPGPLMGEFDTLLLDLDGVVYLGEEPVPGAADGLRAARTSGVDVVFVTNNAAHTAADVVARLNRLGVEAVENEVVTSSMAAADLLAGEIPAGSPVLVVGGPGLRAALAAAGLSPVDTADGVAAVVQGWGPDVTWADLAEATVALRHGARWVATNLDRTLPSPRGPLPGSGALVAAVQTALGRGPDAVAGKPHPPLFEAACRRSGASRPLMVGDRLDTDIAGAVAAGMPSLLVLTGVSTAADLLGAPPEQRPTYIGRDLGALGRSQPGVDADGLVRRPPGDTDDGLDGLRTAAARAWTGQLRPEEYDDVLSALDLH